MLDRRHFLRASGLSALASLVVIPNQVIGSGDSNTITVGSFSENENPFTQNIVVAKFKYGQFDNLDEIFGNWTSHSDGNVNKSRKGLCYIKPEDALHLLEIVPSVPGTISVAQTKTAVHGVADLIQKDFIYIDGSTMRLVLLNDVKQLITI